MSRWVGVDPGSTRIRAVFPDEGGMRRVDAPSVVLLRSDGSRAAASDDDLDRRNRRPGAPVLVRPLARGRLEREQEADVALRALLDRAGGRAARHELALAIPAAASPVERRGWEEFGRRAGVHQLRLVPAPLAKAAAHGLLDGRGALLADLGATCSQAAVVGPGGSVAERRDGIGGVDLDRAIADLLRRRHRLVVGTRVAEEIKLLAVAAGGQRDDELLEVTGRDASSGALRSTELSGAEASAAVRSLLERMVRVVELCLADAPDGLAEDVLGRGVAVTGGSARLVGFADVLRNRLGVAVRTFEDDGFSAAAGAVGVALDGVAEERVVAPPVARAGR